MKGTGWLRTVMLAVRQVRAFKIDVVHTHLTRAAYIGHAVGLLTKVPIVTSVHIANNDRIYRRLARRNNRLVAVSNFVAGMLHGNGVPKSFIETVYNGTDYTDIAETHRDETLREIGIRSERQVIGLVGKVCPDKGQMELIQALGQLRADHPNAHVLLVGRVEHGYGGPLSEEMDRLGVRDQVTMTGSRDDIPRLLDTMQVATLPSVMETFGVAAIEAMARRRPVVASRMGALPELVRHEQTGLLVDLRPDAIAEALDYLLRNPEEAEAMGARGRQLVEEKFTLKAMVDRFEQVYHAVAG